MSPSLSVVAPSDAKKPVVRESVGEKIQRLQAEARSLAKEHIIDLLTAMNELDIIASDIAKGGEAYPAGIRDMARRLSEDLEGRIQTVSAINGRT